MSKQGDSVTVDVVVVGFGAGGISTAITAHDEGAEVVVLEKMVEAHAGGNTRVSGQVWFSPTDIEEAKVYLRGFSDGFTIPEDVIHAWANETAKNDDWMRKRLDETAGKRVVRPEDSYGPGTEVSVVSFGDETRRTGVDANAKEYEWPEMPGNDCGHEYHYIGDSQGYSRLWYTIKAALELRQIPVMYETRAKELIKNKAGEVIGLRADSPDGPLTIFARRGVVLASGGFEANQDMVREFLRLRHSTPWGSPSNTGDGIKMAQKAGADLWHMTSYCGINGIGAPELNTGLLANPPGPSHMIVGNHGKRFISELAGWRHGKLYVDGATQHWPGNPMHWVFDQKALDNAPVSVRYGQYAGSWGLAILGYEWSDDNQPEVDKGWISKGDTVEELAEKLGVNAEGLKQEIDRYNTLCAEGNDVYFDRDPETLVPIEGPPYYGYTWPGLIIFTQGGPRKDAEGRVVDPYGEPIPRLYVAGEISSTYSWITGGGLMIGDALAFGRISGRNASALAPVSDSQPA